MIPTRPTESTIRKRWSSMLPSMWIHRFALWLVRITAPTDDVTSTTESRVDLQPTAATTEDEAASGSNEHLVNVLAVCNVLSVLEGQIHEINQDVESSVAGVCKGFQGMVVRAQSAVSAASESIISGTKGGGKDLIQEMQHVLNSLLGNVRSSSNFTQTISVQLTAIKSRLEAIEKTLGDVEELANKAKIVALNGQIEAARLGSAGRAFAVVAEETKTLSTHAASTSDSIRKLISSLTIEVNTTSEEIRQRTEIDAKRFIESESQAHGLLRDIDINHKQIVQALSKTSEISGELKGDISRAVMSMQFQDRVSQRMAHVAETLEVLMHEADAESFTDCQAEARNLSNKWLHQIAKKYTMDSERQVHAGAELVSAASSSSDDFDVELF